MKKVLYVIAAIAALYLVCCVIGPSTIKVERSASMKASADVIKSQITDYNVFNAWSPWAEKDPNMKITVEGTPGTVGHKYSWEGNKDVGKGTMTIKKIDADMMVEELNFDGKGVSDVTFTLKADSAGTNVSWTMDMNIPFLGRGMMMFMKGKMDKMLGGDFEKGLAKLKTVSEAAATAAPMANYEVKELSWTEGRTYIGTKTTTLTMDKISPFFAENFPKLWGDLTKAKATLAGGPACIVFKMDPETQSGDFAAVVATGEKAEVKGWEKYSIAPCKILKTEYFGAYDKIQPAYEAMNKYLSDKGLTKVLAIEEYITDPTSEKDTSKWQTNVYYTLK